MTAIVFPAKRGILFHRLVRPRTSAVKMFGRWLETTSAFQQWTGSPQHGFVDTMWYFDCCTRFVEFPNWVNIVFIRIGNML